MSFASPNRKDSASNPSGPINNLSLLNYLLYRESHKESITAIMSHRDGPPTSLSREQFSVIEILGKGGFGKVYKVEYRKNRTIYAMKEMSKAV